MHHLYNFGRNRLITKVLGPELQCLFKVKAVFLLWIVLLVTLHVGVCCAAVSVLCSLLVTCWERVDLLAVVFVVFCHFPKCFLVHIRIKGEVGAIKLV